MLRKQVDELKSNLEECTRQMEKTTDQYSRMKVESLDFLRQGLNHAL